MKKTLILSLITVAFSITGCTFNVSTGTNSANTTAANTTSANTTASPGAENKTNSAPANSGSIETAISIDTFSDFPEEIDGCSCYLSNNDAEFKGKKYIYADNYEKMAWVKINGVMTKFNKVEDKQVSKTQSMRKFDNKDYELVIELTQTGKVDETFQQKGTLKLTKKGGQTITKEVNGECGC